MQPNVNPSGIRIMEVVLILFLSGTIELILSAPSTVRYFIAAHIPLSDPATRYGMTDLKDEFILIALSI